MPAERPSIRKIRELLRLRFGSRLLQRAIAESLGLSQGDVSTYLSRVRVAGVVWPLSKGLDDAQLEVLLFSPPPDTPADREATSCDNKRLARRLREARLMSRTSTSGRIAASIDRTPFLKLATCEWIREPHHLVDIGRIGGTREPGRPRRFRQADAPYRAAHA